MQEAKKPVGLNGVEEGKCLMAREGTVQTHVEGFTGPEVGRQRH